MRNHHYLKYIFLLALVIRIIFSVYYFENNEISAFEDIRIAQNIAEGNGYSEINELGSTAIKAPGYPYFAAFFILIFGSSFKLAIILSQQLLFTISGYYFFKLISHLFNKKAGMLAVGLYLFYPSFIFYPVTLEAASLSIPFSVITAYALLLAYQKSIKYLLLSAFLAGILYLIQPVFSIIIFIFLTALVYKKQFNKAAVLTVIFVIIISPWIIRNYVKFDEFIPTKSPVWMNVYTGLKGEINIIERYDLTSDIQDKKIDSLRELKNDVEMEKYYKGISKNVISANPLLYIEKCGFNLLQLWLLPSKHFTEIDLKVYIFRLLPLLLLHYFAVMGLIRLYNKDKHLAIGIASILILASIPYLFTHAHNIRFKLEFEWIEMIPAVYYLFGRQSKESGNK